MATKDSIEWYGRTRGSRIANNFVEKPRAEVDEDERERVSRSLDWFPNSGLGTRFLEAPLRVYCATTLVWSRQAKQSFAKLRSQAGAWERGKAYSPGVGSLTPAAWGSRLVAVA